MRATYNIITHIKCYVVIIYMDKCQPKQQHDSAIIFDHITSQRLGSPSKCNLHILMIG